MNTDSTVMQLTSLVFDQTVFTDDKFACGSDVYGWDAYRWNIL